MDLQLIQLIAKEEYNITVKSERFMYPEGYRHLAHVLFFYKGGYREPTHLTLAELEYMNENELRELFEKIQGETNDQ